MVRKGNYKQTPIGVQQELRTAFQTPSMFPTLTSIAKYYGVSKTTVKRYLSIALREGVISRNNHLFNSTKQNRASAIISRRAKLDSIRKYLLDCARSGTPISVNSVQAKFGLDKASIGAQITAVNARLSMEKKPLLIRLTKSSQPKRTPLR